MNLNPGGSQCQLQDGWFMHNGVKIIQLMIFQNDPPTNPNQLKGIKVMLEEHGLWIPCLHLECKKPKCKIGATLCCAWQLFGQQQKSLVQEVIKVAGHLCIFLLKFHCELNIIEFFGGAVKKYLCDNSNYTFGTLKEELLKALASVNVKTIRKIGASHNVMAGCIQ